MLLAPKYIIGTEKYPEAGFNLNCDGDKYSQGYAQIVSFSKVSTEIVIFQPYKTQKILKTKVVIDAFVITTDGGYQLFVFDIRFQKDFSTAQHLKKNNVERKTPADVVG